MKDVLTCFLFSFLPNGIVSSGGNASRSRPSSGGEAGRDSGGAGAPGVKRRARGSQKRAASTLKRHKSSSRQGSVDDYLNDFGLRKIEVSRGGQKSISLECKFCVFFGREAKVGSRRKVATTIQIFTGTFRRENFKGHLERCHESRWNDYKLLSKPEREKFFDKQAPLKSTLFSHFGPKQSSRAVIFDAKLVDVIVGRILMADGKDTGVEEIDLRNAAAVAKARENAMSVFEPCDPRGGDFVEADGNGDDEDVGPSHYRVLLKNLLQFKLVISFVSNSVSFRGTYRCLMDVRALTGLAAIGSVNMRKVIQNVRVACAWNFQMLAAILDSCWTFASALDMATYQSTGYLDIRVRLFLVGKIWNFHLIAAPMATRHTGMAD